MLIHIFFERITSPHASNRISGEEVIKLSRRSELEKKIEETREMLYQVYLENPKNPQVVSISQELDELLNEYESSILE